MNQQSFSLLAGIIFTIIALLHPLRIIYGWDPVVEGWTVPKWISSSYAKTGLTNDRDVEWLTGQS